MARGLVEWLSSPSNCCPSRWLRVCLERSGVGRLGPRTPSQLPLTLIPCSWETSSRGLASGVLAMRQRDLSQDREETLALGVHRVGAGQTGWKS